MQDFAGKVALITGAGSGLGREFALEAHRRGMRLFLADIREDAVRRTVQEILAQGGTAVACVADVSLEADVDRMIREAMEACGRIDLLINNAGIPMGGSVVDLPAREWEWAIQVNCMSQVYAMKRVIPIMSAQDTAGHIVNVASAAGLNTLGQMNAYVATKHFSVALSESVWYDMQAQGEDIRVSVVCPGFMHTGLHRYEQSRPARFADKTDPFYSSRTYAALQESARREVTGGKPMGDIGAQVFDAIEKDAFYILPHKEEKVLIRYRMRNILLERTPDIRFSKAVLLYRSGYRSFKTLLRILKLW